MTTANAEPRGYAADLNENNCAAGSRTYYPSTEHELKRRLKCSMNIYDTCVWGSLSIKRLPFHYYRVRWGENGQSERLGGKTATYALAVLLRRLGLDN